MGKTRAQIQKAYRERKKLNDPSFTDILTAIEAPDSIGKSGRFYQVSTETLNLIEKLKTDAMDKAAKSP